MKNKDINIDKLNKKSDIAFGIGTGGLVSSIVGALVMAAALSSPIVFLVATHFTFLSIGTWVAGFVTGSKLKKKIQKIEKERYFNTFELSHEEENELDLDINEKQSNITKISSKNNILHKEHMANLENDEDENALTK